MCRDVPVVGNSERGHPEFGRPCYMLLRRPIPIAVGICCVALSDEDYCTSSGITSIPRYLAAQITCCTYRLSRVQSLCGSISTPLLLWQFTHRSSRLSGLPDPPR